MEAPHRGPSRAAHHSEVIKYFRRRPRDWRQRLIRQPWTLPVVAMHLAAIEIQVRARVHRAPRALPRTRRQSGTKNEPKFR